MRFERTASFKADYRRLSENEKELFRRAARAFNRACDAFIADPGGHGWPNNLRVKPVKAAESVFEMTWSFSGPDGRATWEWTDVAVTDPDTGETTRAPAVRWRRIGGHRIFTDP